jgi:hypothetical protein
VKNSITTIVLALTILVSCGEKSTKKRGLDDTLFQYASLVRWSNYDAALRFLKPSIKEIKPTDFELEHLKQFKVSSYRESPITPGSTANTINQNVEIQLYNVHNNTVRTINDSQIWEYDDELQRWFLITGIPKI